MERKTPNSDLLIKNSSSIKESKKSSDNGKVSRQQIMKNA